MRLWMFMSDEARTVLKRQGFLAGDPARIMEPSFLPAYEWMARQMHQRIGPDSDGSGWPLWAWRLSAGLERPDPDDECHGPLTDASWLIGFEADDSKVLLSDFSEWHFPLNGWLLPGRNLDDDAVERLLDEFDASLKAAGVDWHARPYPEPFRSLVEASWNLVFDVDLARARTEKESIQATVWRVEASSVFEEAKCRRIQQGLVACDEGS